MHQNTGHPYNFAETLILFGQKIEVRHRGGIESGSRRITCKPGDLIEIRANVGYVSVNSNFLSAARFVDPVPDNLTTIRYLPFGDEPIEELVEVSPRSNRMGIRLLGGTPNSLELPSEPTCPGAIQQTPSGEYIVIGPDGPTIGGYPRIGVVIEADIRILPYLSPGMAVSLQPVDLKTATVARQSQLAQSAQAIKLLQLGIN